MRIGMIALMALCACSDLPSTDDGVVELRVTTPGSLVLPQGSVVQLTARAFDRNGEEIEAAITWETPDASITLEPVAGSTTTVTAVEATGIGRVQAAVGTLRSDLITFTLQAAPGILRD